MSESNYGKGHVKILDPPYDWEKESEDTGHKPEITAPHTDPTTVDQYEPSRVEGLALRAADAIASFPKLVKSLIDTPSKDSNEQTLREAIEASEKGESVVVHIRW